MTPEQQRKHQEALRELEEWAREPEPSLITLTTIYRGQKTVANALLFHVEENRTWRAAFVKKYEKLVERFNDLRRRYNESRGMRERMPTLNPDDSGSIEIGALGAKAAFHGKLPVRVAVVLLIAAVGVGAGYIAGCRVRSAGASTSAQGSR